MGGEDKEKNITRASENSDHVKEVFDTSMSRLLQDFNSAELFSNTSEVPKGPNFCPESDCDTVVSSMKHLHLRRPVFPKQKKTRMCTVKKKNSPNRLNLAVAACGYHRPIVWPARLSCHTDKCHSNVLRPSRLPIKKKATSEHVTKPSPSTCLPSIEKLPQREDYVVFGNGSALDFSSLSFSRLSEQATENVKDATKLQVQDCCASTSFQATSAKSVCKRKNASSVPAVKFARTLVEEAESGASQAVHLDYRTSGTSYSFSSGHDSTFSQSDRIMTRTSTVTTHQAATLYTPSSLENQPRTATSFGQSDYHGSTENLSYPSSQDEANVNEMASYFEDLLHIPRKMSTMAEMMYA